MAFLASHVALITPSLVILAAILSALKLNQIHFLVNSRMTEALNEIAALKKKVAELQPEDKEAQDASAVATYIANKDKK